MVLGVAAKVPACEAVPDRPPPQGPPFLVSFTHRSIKKERASMTAIGTCAHLTAITTIKQPQRRVCDECVKIGGGRGHVGTGQQCGATLCCDNPPHTDHTKPDPAN